MKTINKELFIKNIDIMINNSSKGASGFWYDTEDFCGNPEVFIVIKKVLKEHNSVNLEHDIWSCGSGKKYKACCSRNQ